MPDKPSAFHDLPPDAFPMTVDFLSEATGEVLETHTIDGPGAFRVPGQDHWGETVLVRITYGNGVVITNEESDG